MVPQSSQFVSMVTAYLRITGLDYLSDRIPLILALVGAAPKNRNIEIVGCQEH